MTDPNWWRSAVIYQVYPRSFADSDGDGLGDLPGLISRLDYLATLSIDAIWISPCYVSPLHDGGYDVADYRAIDPRLGDLDVMRTLLDQAHARDIKIFMDLVPNHSSSDHAWFQEALAAGPGSTAWDRYVIRKGKGPRHDLPPNNWRSVFHGAGWSPMPLPDGTPSEYWYLHLFDSTQPDLNWENPEVREEFHSILRFWFDFGIDGFRIDVAHGLVKADGLPDRPESAANVHVGPFWDQDGVHEIYREWRKIADAYDDPRVFCGEAWTPSEDRLANYVRPDELQTCFNFEYLVAGWDAARMREVIDQTIATHSRVGAPPTWVLSNHDVVRHRTRLAPVDKQGNRDLVRGLDRARAATLFTFALPGSAYVYQGEELGLPEVLDLGDEVRQDPAWFRSKGTDGLRDGCRVPIPWTADGATFGFNDGSETWLPQPAAWQDLAVAAEDGVEGSTLEFYRRALRIRREESSLGDGTMEWIDLGAKKALGIRRTASDGSAVVAVLNLRKKPLALPAALGTEVLVESGDAVAVLTTDRDEDVLTTDRDEYLVLGPETCVWLRP